jgi:hypothetical protein
MHSEKPRRAPRRKDSKQNGAAPVLSRHAANLESPNSIEEISTPQPSQAEETSSSALPSATRIEAQVDIGFGNRLFLRGEGDGLSWIKGIPLTCVAPAIWVWSAEAPRQKLTFKLLLNDDLWSRGDNWVVQPGESIAVVPSF